MRPYRLVLLLSIVLCTLAAEIPAGMARAAGGVTVSLQPSDSRGRPLAGPGYFVLTMRAGEARSFHAVLVNRTPRRTRVSLAPVDAGRDRRGNVVYRLPTARRSGVGAWVHIFRSNVALAAGTAGVIGFTVHVPTHTHPGNYIGALTAFVPVGRPTTSTRDVLRVQFRLADAIVVTVRP